ncbi:hypothetical protein EV2_011010 [Malus domestica]|uniref:uncharacterized protein n=1 Tax=Malus domestica TaxID=3750 RepID=UPI0010AADEB0|nr:uncharacterized protein LOC103423683 [Malus domestica]
MVNFLSSSFSLLSFAKLLVKSIWLPCAIALALCFEIWDAESQKHCAPVSCGDLHNIRYPFRLNGSSSDQNCLNRLNHPAVLSCQHNNTILNLYNGTYYVRKINYDDHTIHVVDPGLLSDTCPPWPLRTITTRNFSAIDRYQAYGYGANDYLVFVDCQFPVEFLDYVKYNCNTSSATSYSYIVNGALLDRAAGNLSCDRATTITILALLEEIGNFTSSSFIHHELQRGFKLSWEGFLLCGSRDQSISIHCILEPMKLGFRAGAKIAGLVLIGQFVYGCIVGLRHPRTVYEKVPK